MDGPYGKFSSKEKNTIYCRNYRMRNKEKNKEYYRNYYLRKKLEKEQVNDEFGFLLLFQIRGT
jgi:hypothetical protein